MMDQSTTAKGAEPKRTSLDMLSKDELLQKCKNLLSIAQRAKIAKDETLEESKILKEELEAMKKSKSEGKATTEMLESLTAQKLQLTIELDESRRVSKAARVECDNLRKSSTEQEVQIESLRRQLVRSEDNCSVLEARLERLDAENRHLVSVANEAEAQLRRGAAERQNVLEGLGDELANIKNAAAEALAERDRLRVQLQQNNPSTNSQSLESCQVLAQELRSSQSLLRADVFELQSAASVMAEQLGEALDRAQSATEAAARHRSKDLLAEMNEAMKTRGEVAAQLAQKLSDMTRERDSLLCVTQMHDTKVKQLEDKCQHLEEKQEQLVLSLKSKVQELQHLQETWGKLQQENLKLEGTVDNILKEKQDLSGKCQNLKTSVTQVEKEKEKLEKILDEVRSALHLETEKLGEKTMRVSSLEDKVKTLQELSNKVNEEVKKLQDIKVTNLQTISELRSKICEMEEQTEDKQAPSSDGSDELNLAQEQNCGLKNELEKVKSENEKLKQNVSCLEEEVAKYEHLREELEKKEQSIGELQLAKQGCELVISSMKQDIENFESIETERQILEDEVLSLKENEVKLSEALSNIDKLNLEVTELKSALNEKYVLEAEINEMRLKYKELSATIEKQVSSSEETNLHKELSELKFKNKELSDTIFILKDKLCDLEKEREECEGASVSTVSRTEDSARLRDVEESFEERYTKLRAVAVKLKQKCHDQAGVLSKLLAERTELQTKLTTLSKEKDMMARNVQSMQAACDAATDDAEAARDSALHSNKELKRAGEELAHARNQYADVTEKMGILEAKLQQSCLELETAKQEKKKSSVLNLEMAAYERSAAEQEKRLNHLKEEVESLKAEIECQKAVAEDNKKHAKQWEEQSTQLSQTKTRLEEQLSDAKSQLSLAQDQFTTESQRHTEAITKFEVKRSELERIELQLAEMTSEKLCSDEASKLFKDRATRQIHILEEQVSSALATVKSREDELNCLHLEFDGYKVRAQAVLHRQQQQQPQREDQSKEAERENELCVLKTSVERLQTALCDAGGKEKSLQAEILVLTGQNIALQTSARELATQVAEMNAKCEELSSKLHRSEESLRDTSRQHRLALDTLSSSYKQQLSEAEKRHKAQVASIQAAKEEMAQQVNVEQEQSPVLQPREEGEGSENVDSPKAAICDHRREPLPLERLLSSSSDFPDDAKSELSLDTASVSSVLAAERRAKHLAALLGEAEADLARLTQQNAVLKEEIRRQQRCMERQQHTLSNGEYLKNVVLKFVTLQEGDERARLVPVLNTILKLSPEETQQLQTVANGTSTPPPGSTSSSGSWGSYLHLWSGTH